MRPRWRHRSDRHGPPRAVRRTGCAFGLLIVFTAAAASVLSSLMTKTAIRPLAVVVAFASIVLITAIFVLVLRRVANDFREQLRLRRQLMTDVAHELRTPLAILQGRVEGMIDGVYPRDDAHLEELLAETRHLGRLVEDVRTLANAEAGALDLRKERVDLAELIRDTASSFGPRITVDAPPELMMDVDPVRIREVLLNVLGNAVEHGGDGAIAVTVEARTIRIADRGPGIPPEELPRLFGRFHKGAGSRGTGLGLSIAKKLVEAHGGRIAIDSVMGIGTTVTITL